MKKILFSLLMLISANALQAQFQNFTQTFDSVMMHVSRADATTGILYDRVIPFAGVPRFSQWASQKDTANADRFLLAYNELYNAAFQHQVRLPFPVDSLGKLIITTGNKVDVGILHYHYNKINDTLMMQKLYFDADSIVRENSACTTSLYVELTSFIASPLRMVVDTTAIAFRFNDLLWFDNTNNPITQLLVDFGAGNGLQTVGLNTTITVNYEA